jgi:3'-phosphoadenosine 5'-phosphosulfate (PAPS) 3'-phosphatase
LVEILYSQISFRDIVGEEEDECHHDNEATPKGTIAGDESWFQVQGLTIPNDLRPVVESTKASIHALATTQFLTSSETNSDIQKCLDYQHLTVFIDPIDGTREFSTGKGEQCSVCIGFANENGKAVAGVIYRPLSQPKPTWVTGAKSERFVACDFGGDNVIHSLDDSRISLFETNNDENKRRGSLLTTNGSISPFVESLIKELQMERVKSGGAGNKLMMLLEHSLFDHHADGGSALYIQDRGVSRWDTCGAEGVLEAFGGNLMKLTTFLPETMDGEDEQNSINNREFYTYLASQTNLDFIPGVATITKYNCGPSTRDVQLNQKAHDVNDVKAYSNLCGLVAFGKEWNTPEGAIYIEKAIQRAAKIHPPSFD